MLSDKEKLFCVYYTRATLHVVITTQHDTISRNNVRACAYVAPHKKKILC